MNPVSREEMARMISELSDDALQYVQLPVLYAYYYTDYHDPDRLSDDDSRRFGLIRAALLDSAEMVKWLTMRRRSLYAIERKNAATT